MRTFNHIEIYKKIKENPFEYIGQRSFNLLECFMMHIDSQTEVNFDSNRFKEFNEMPCIREFVSKKTSTEISQSLRWTWAIGFEIEDQRNLLTNYFDWIDKYENEYPVESSDYNFDCKLSSEFDITSSIKHMCKRPRMYGFNDLSGLRATIDGYFYLKKLYQLDLTSNQELLSKFINNWKNKVNQKLKFETWDRSLIKDKMGINPFTFGGGSNGGWVFERFIQILEEETDIELKGPEIIKST